MQSSLRSPDGSKRLRYGVFSPTDVACVTNKNCRMLTLVAVAAVSTSGTVAPRVEIYTRTICRDYGLDVGPAGCRSDPKVQAAAAQLMAIISASCGFLSTVTAAWWGSVSQSRQSLQRELTVPLHSLAVRLLRPYVGAWVQCGWTDVVRPKLHCCGALLGGAARHLLVVRPRASNRGQCRRLVHPSLTVPTQEQHSDDVPYSLQASPSPRLSCTRTFPTAPTHSQGKFIHAAKLLAL